jgi:predicted ATPase
MPIKSLRIRNMGPFTDINLEFDKHANVLIGPNNCGKTTILMALSEICIYPFSVDARFFRSNKRPKLNMNLFDQSLFIDQTLPWMTTSNDVKVMRELGYAVFIPALRQNTGFRPKSPMGREEKRESGRIIGRMRDDEEDTEELESYSNRINYREEDINFLMKQKNEELPKEEEKELERRHLWISNNSRMTDRKIVSKIVELDYRAYRKSEPRFREVVSIATNIASEIMLGYSVVFDRIEEDKRGLYPQFITPDGPLSMDKLSQGTQSVMEWMYHIILGMAEYYDFPNDLVNKKAILIIDEIDAHMHPEWQRRIMTTLIKYLPNCQLFVSTHSPLILSGLGRGQIHLLTRGNRNKISDTKNDSEIIGWSEVDPIVRTARGLN